MSQGLRHRRPAALALADGTVYRGTAFGAEGVAAGEVCFNTSMTGYQEILTDPSYRGQMVCMTYPLIGNYGINPDDVESRRPWLAGFIVKEACPFPSSWRSRVPLDDYLREHGIVGIQGIDTRALTRHLRDRGAQEGIISTRETDGARLAERARALPGLSGRDLVTEVSVEAPHGWTEGPWDLTRGYASAAPARFKVVAFDSGIKQNILRCLAGLGCNVEVMPADTTAAAVRERKPDGIFLSNGPGDPEAVPYLIETVRGLIGKTPIFGICLGNQILGLAFGGRTYKLKFGHHGGNQPVIDLASRRVAITSQNHGFAVDPESLPAGVRATELNLNDGTVEGLAVDGRPVLSVQYHPEAAPGPHDASPLFRRFLDSIPTRAAGR